MKKSLLFLFSLLPSLSWAGDNDDFGTWLELGAEKALPYTMEIGLEGGLRTLDASSVMDRWDVGGSFRYKAHKYLKLAAGYSFLMDYNQQKTTKQEYDEDDQLESYRVTPAYWSLRHRMYLEASSGLKLWKCLRISVRVRYQFTYRQANDVNRIDNERNDMFTPDGIVTEWVSAENPKHYDGEGRQVLRSRIKLEVDKKHLEWKPFVSAEFHNNVASGEHMNFDKLRTSVGTEYKINKHNSVSLSYVMTLNRMEQPFQRMHAINAGYSFDF